MKSGLKLILITLPILLIGVGVLFYIVSTSPPPEQIPLAERATAVRVITARNQAVAPRLTGFGVVQPSRTYEAITQVGGTAEYVNPSLQKGEILPAGAVLLRLSAVDFNLAIAQARANIRAAEAKLAELAVSEANLKSALVIEQEALALKDNDLARTQTLFTNGTISQTVLDGAKSTHLAQRQKVLSLESSLALLPTQRAVQTEQIAVYQSSLETATLNLERTELKLPFAARVASVSVEVGQFVRVGQTAAVLDGIESAEVEAQVSVAGMSALLQTTNLAGRAMEFDPSTMTQMLKGLGLTAVVRLQLGQAYQDWPASLDRISDTIDQKTGTLGVIVRVDSAYRGVGPGKKPPLAKGMFVEVTLSAPPIEGVVIPRSALRAGQVLLAGEDARLILVPVSPYLVQDTIALIRDGLDEGSQVIVSTPSPVISGMLLDITEDTALMAQLAKTGVPE